MLTVFNVAVGYLTSPSAVQAVILPGIVAILLTLVHRKEFAREMLAPFVIGTFQSVFLSMWMESDEQLSLHLYPACVLMLVAMPRQYRPSWQVGYAMSFGSLLCSDFICTLRYSMDKGCTSLEFFCGVGGAGFHDALFWLPLLGALVLAVLNYATSKGADKVNIRMPFTNLMNRQ